MKNQNAGARNACPIVKFLPGNCVEVCGPAPVWWPVDSAGALCGTGVSPSGNRPISCGLVRMNFVIGSTSRNTAMPVTTAPVSHPHREMMKASNGARMTPPMACDAMPMPIAWPFLRLNQLLIVAQLGAKPPMFAPRETMKVHVTMKSRRFRAKSPKRIIPRPMRNMPTKIGGRGPNRSMK